MSDPTPGDIDRFYRATGSKLPCSCCGHSDWQLVDPQEPNSSWALGSVNADGSMRIPQPSVPVLALACTTCFALRLHALLPIEMWLSANPAGGAEKP